MKKILVTGAAGFIGFHVAASSSSAAIGSSAGQLQRYLRRHAEGIALRILEERRASREREWISPIETDGGPLREEQFDASCISPRSRSPLLHREPACVRRIERQRVPEHPRRSESAEGGHLVYARRAPSTGSIRRCPSRRSRTPTIRSRCIQRPRKPTKRWRTPMPISSTSPARGLRFFTVYGPLGSPRHGALQVHQGNPERRADPRSSTRGR
jgi:hypothetical protein